MDRKHPGRELIYSPLSEVPEKQVKWLPLERFRIPIGKLTLFVGDPGEGKSYVVGSIVTELTTTHGFTVAMLTEDDASDTVRPRYRYLGADLTRIQIITGTKTVLGEDAFVLLQDLEAFKKFLDDTKPGLVVFDPLVSYSHGVDDFKGPEVRKLLDPYIRVAADREIALIGVIHLNKADTKALYKITSSIQYSAIARSVYLVGPYQDRKAIAHVKTNIGEKSPSWSFHLEPVPENPDYAKLTWDEEILVNADELINGSNSPTGRITQEDVAKALLIGRLSAGACPSQKLGELSKKLTHPVSDKTLERAKVALGVTSKPVGARGKRGASEWCCRLPEYEDPTVTTDSGGVNELIEQRLSELDEKLCKLLKSQENHTSSFGGLNSGGLNDSLIHSANSGGLRGGLFPNAPYVASPNVQFVSVNGVDIAVDVGAILSAEREAATGFIKESSKTDLEKFPKAEIESWLSWGNEWIQRGNPFS
jgi:hypothetical protein